MVELNRRQLMRASVAAAVGAGVSGVTSAQRGGTGSSPTVRGELKRFATTAYGAEVTGPFVLDGGQLIFSLQHPTDPDEADGPVPVRNDEEFRDGAIGYVEGFRFDADGDSDEFDELGIPDTKAKQGTVRTAAGSYTVLAREKQSIGGGAERLGVPKTPDGTEITGFDGSKYSAFGNDPDMNQFVRTGDGEGYLFTNFEQSPGSVSRIPITVGADGSVSADLAGATNLENYDAFRDIGGTRINCYGDLSPWGTPLSAEEEYAHARVSLAATTGDMVENGGVGRRGAAEFFNRPDPTGIQAKVGEYYDEGWYVQGSFALAGVELLAYYLGADPADRTGDGDDLAPIEGSYPNRYRYGYIVDFRNPAADDPADVEPVKYYVMGRGAWEAPDVQADERTAYLTSDGANKGLYKFVADRPIPEWDDPADVAGTLYAPKVTNRAAARNNPPGTVDLEIEWLELGHATNAEVESWIAEYDGIDQVDYLESHIPTWEAGDAVTESTLETADREVIENGNRDYVTDSEVVEWAEQYAANGPGGVDEALRRVPFLETRAAAKEIGATIEFRKAEGIDSVEGAGPGDYVYVGLSEVNDGMADDEGDIRMKQVDGGMVYRGRLEADYNLSTLEPVIVGPNSNDPAAISDDALLNIDNVYVLDDGRVLCCEDADQLGRSYPNDGLYVYEPEPGPSGTDPGASGDTPT
ncbi:MAG: alkaline phosphatase PhoX [Haloferacaceae archaeon]